MLSLKKLRSQEPDGKHLAIVLIRPSRVEMKLAAAVGKKLN